MSREKMVRDEAYAIWEAEGRPEGRDRDHWRQAEERVAGLKPSKDAKVAAPKAREKKSVAASGEKAALAKPPAKAAATSPARSSKKKS